MTAEKTITICGQEVKMIYCAATENCFEQISSNKIHVFIPTFGKNDKGEDIILEPAKATIGDFVTLGMAGIIAAYIRTKQDSPVDSKYILYEATPQERNDLVTAIVELRKEWYEIPASVAETLKNDAEGAKEEESAKN